MEADLNWRSLQRKGFILIHVEGGLVQSIYKPKKWCGSVIVIDFDVEGATDFFTIKVSDGTIRNCFYSQR